MDPIRQLLLIGIAALIVYFIPMEPAIKRICYIVIGVAVLLVLLAALFGFRLL
jgi:hypothetical protein